MRGDHRELRTDATADDPNRVVTVTAQNGKTGNEVSISYTNCKVVGNGSFGVVFAAKMLGKSYSIQEELELTSRRERRTSRGGFRDCHQEGTPGQTFQGGSFVAKHGEAGLIGRIENYRS